jgi:ABC-type bacteriocin/lantibiotic exporter with double-glycine peptidase domain
MRLTKLILQPRWLLAAAVASTLGVIGPFTWGLLQSKLERHPTWDGQQYVLGWEGVAWQRDYRSCGPAVVTTLLQVFYNKDLSYYDVLNQTQLGPEGISLAQFQRLAGHFGIQGSWFKTEKKTELDRLPMPLVAHLDHPVPHYVVVESSYDGFVLVADPAKGRILYPKQVFDGLWSGRIFKLENLKAMNAEPRTQVQHA